MAKSLKLKSRKILQSRELERLIGRAQEGALTKEDQDKLAGHLDLFHAKLDECDQEDFFGTEGWRHFFEMED